MWEKQRVSIGKYEQITSLLVCTHPYSTPTNIDLRPRSSFPNTPPNSRTPKSLPSSHQPPPHQLYASPPLVGPAFPLHPTNHCHFIYKKRIVTSLSVSNWHNRHYSFLLIKNFMINQKDETTLKRRTNYHEFGNHTAVLKHKIVMILLFC